MAQKAPVLRMLEARKIAHDVFTFDSSVRDAFEVAREVGIAPELVYKTLVIEQDPAKGRPYLVMAPSTVEVDLKVLARELNVKKLRMASHRDAERYTGLQVGGISALAIMGRNFPVLIDQRAVALEQILVSGGQRGIDVRLAVRDLLALTGARPIAIGSPDG